MLTRRAFFGAAAGASAAAVLARRLAAGQDKPYRLSACDWSLGARGPDGLAVAKAAGLEGLEVSPGGVGEHLGFADPAYRARYKEAMKRTGVVVSSTALGCLNRYPLATEPRAPRWLEEAIDATADLGARVILLPFFGRGDLRAGGGKAGLKTKEVDAVVGRLKAAAPRAEAKGVVLGLETTLSARDTLAICERVGSPAVAVYYDIGNSTAFGYDVPAEIRLLGRRICQFHFKDRKHGYLGRGEVRLEPVAEAIRAIGYRGWIVLETGSPTKDRVADFRKNAATVRRMMGMEG